MLVNSEQLIPGCILIRDVKGKTNQPLIPRHTVLTTEHIVILQKFLIQKVDVSKKLSNGNLYEPKTMMQDTKKQVDNPIDLSFQEHYHYVVQQYKQLFEGWQNGLAIDVPTVRDTLVPLLERMEDISDAIYTLHHFATKEDYFFHHNVAIAILSAYLGYKTGYVKGEWLQIGFAGFLADCGMARIESSIIQTNRSLTPEEVVEIKKHPTYSYRLTEKLPTLKQAVKQAILQHHERMDGSGYPLGLSKGKIHRYARIIAVCDMYHAIICERVYKEKQSPFKAIEILQQEQFTKLDPDVVYTFIQGMTNFPIGTRIKLSNNQLGEIVYTDIKKPTRPMIRLSEQQEEIVALQNHPELFIVDVLK
ncbi:HD-GYP domain-containing protein [Virgibacillus salexigens]|uniref:HD-GYP domain-containing protein n=1 Tax=Virgibacillus salexigens TaxID=61016 RepID=UPI00190BB427|nr:HD-GYP domain-containing protein [Virgibacillus salexigens]